jgi:hypothetical protein
MYLAAVLGHRRRFPDKWGSWCWSSIMSALPPRSRSLARTGHHIEFLRYEPDSTVPEIIKANPHIAFRVAALAPHIEGQEIIIPPFVVGDFLEVVFIRKHNTIFEYMHYLKEGWFSGQAPQ